jgi:riboflavin kinase/FMN adenylyltransferase
LNLPLHVMTFDPHPAAILRPDAQPQLLTEPPRRVELLEQFGASMVDVVTFDSAIAATTADEFALEYFVNRHQAQVIVVGANFRFGRDAQGDGEFLAALGLRLGFDSIVVPLAADTALWSSTRVRSALADGDVALARSILGRPHELTGVVQHGDGRGRELGLPTANLRLGRNVAIPAPGVYAGYLITEVEAAHPMPAAISVGSNPQFGGHELRVEAYVLDRSDLELYDQTVTVEFTSRLRDQEVFASLEQYLEQMPRDVQATRLALAQGEDSCADTLGRHRRS